MARPKLYLTTEAKQEANRAKSKRSYERHRIVTNERRRQRYQPRDSTLTTAATTNTSRADNARQTVPGVTYCVHRIQWIQTKLDRIFDGQLPYVYVDKMRCQYMMACNLDAIQDAVGEMTRYRTTVYRHQASLLQLLGPESDAWKEAEVARQRLGQLIQGLEDLEIHAMMGPTEVQGCYEKHELAYQSW